MKKDLVAKVMAIVLMAGVFGWFIHSEEMAGIKRMEAMPVAEVAQEAMTPAFSSQVEMIMAFIAFGVTIVILTELIGFFIRIILFRKIEETNIVHNHNITLQIPGIDEIKDKAA